MGVDAEHGQVVMALEVVCVPARSDNYIWLVHDPVSGETAVVDPADAEPALEAAAARGWRIGQIWNTHWHGDHIGGNAAIVAATGCTITAPLGEGDRIPLRDAAVVDGDSVSLGAHRGRVIAVPGHTAGHVAYAFDDDRLLFCGDTLFALGCGRLFEGTADEMHTSLGRLMALPDDTAVYCAHEYTEANGRFALTVEPDNQALIARMTDVRARRAQGLPTVPSTIGLERATNPFTRTASVADFAARRAAKDVFQG